MISQKLVNFSLIIMTAMLTNMLASAQTSSPSPESVNWTTCQEFVNNTVFDYEKVLNIDWKIFFFWNPETEESYEIRFSKPTDMLIDRFRAELDKEVKPSVNWSDAELFMETASEFSALFVRTNQSGIYRIIPASAFDYNVPIPVLLFGMKLVEPGYLGISNCMYRICYALAPVDKLPYHYELEKAARLLKFYNPYNRTHIAVPQPRITGVPYVMKDEPDDEQLEDSVEHDSNKLQFL